MGIPKDRDTRTNSNSPLVPFLELSEREKQLIEFISRRAADQATEAVLDTLDEKIIEVIYDRIAQEIGKGIIRKGVWALGVVVTAFFIWAYSWLTKGFIK